MHKFRISKQSLYYMNLVRNAEERGRNPFKDFLVSLFTILTDQDLLKRNYSSIFFIFILYFHLTFKVYGIIKDKITEKK